MSACPVKTSLERDGSLLHLRLARPKANIIDAAMIGALQLAFDQSTDNPDLRAILLDAEGPNFSFGASVEEHLPDQCEKMLKDLHQLVVCMLESPVPVLVAVQGQCLGGGLELACSGSLLFATADTSLGQPEIQLAVFAPAASCLLPELIGRATACDLLLSGRSISGAEAKSLGLVSSLGDKPQELALEYFDQHLAAHSASSLRLALRAAQAGLAERVRAKLAIVERIYLDELMATHDAVEGLQAFVEKRPANWENR